MTEPVIISPDTLERDISDSDPKHFSNWVMSAYFMEKMVDWLNLHEGEPSEDDPDLFHSLYSMIEPYLAEQDNLVQITETTMINVIVNHKLIGKYQVLGFDILPDEILKDYVNVIVEGMVNMENISIDS